MRPASRIMVSFIMRFVLIAIGISLLPSFATAQPASLAEEYRLDSLRTKALNDAIKARLLTPAAAADAIQASLVRSGGKRDAAGASGDRRVETAPSGLSCWAQSRLRLTCALFRRQSPPPRPGSVQRDAPRGTLRTVAQHSRTAAVAAVAAVSAGTSLAGDPLIRTRRMETDMKRILAGALAVALSTTAFAQAGMAPSSPVNGSTPTGATPMGSPGDSGSGMGTMDAGNQSMAGDPATTDKGMTKPHSKHHKMKGSSSMRSDPSMTPTNPQTPR